MAAPSSPLMPTLSMPPRPRSAMTRNWVRTSSSMAGNASSAGGWPKSAGLLIGERRDSRLHREMGVDAAQLSFFLFQDQRRASFPRIPAAVTRLAPGVPEPDDGGDAGV